MHRKSVAVVLRITAFVAFTAALFTFAAVPSSFADKGGQGKGGGNSGKGASHGNGNAKGGQGGNGNSDNRGGGNSSKGKGPHKFEASQRNSIQSYYRDEYSRSGNCPPGLAKKNNGCQPPGQAKRNWDVGQPLPPDIEFYPLPPPLRATLVAPLPGYDYGYVDGGVVLFSTSNRIVVDFVIAY